MRTLLAQRLTEFPFEAWCKVNDLHPRDVAIVQSCVENLRKPWEGNHVVLPHRTLGPVYAAEAEQRSVAIYHFNAEAREAANSIGESRRRTEYVLDLARAPGPRCFFEWQNHEKGLEHLAHGIYAEGDRHHYRFVRWCDLVDDKPQHRPMPVCWGWFSLDSCKGYLEVTEKSFSPERERLIKGLQYETTKELAFFWVFLASTGATVIERTPAPRGSSRKHSTHGPGAAILSFNRVRLILPQGLIARTNTVEWERGPGVRRHEVRAHPSFYWTGSREHRSLVVRWIAAYWRGNARLGLVLKAHDVETKT